MSVIKPKKDKVHGTRLHFLLFFISDSTGFKSTSCFVITRVLTADTLKIEVTLNGDVFYEHTYSVSVPVCFHANKVRVLDDGRGVIKDMIPIMKKLPVKILRRRVVQHFLNSFLPNQSKLGKIIFMIAPVYLYISTPTFITTVSVEKSKCET